MANPARTCLCRAGGAPCWGSTAPPASGASTACPCSSRTDKAHARGHLGPLTLLLGQILMCLVWDKRMPCRDPRDTKTVLDTAVLCTRACHLQRQAAAC